jgi:hypothetical protein
MNSQLKVEIDELIDQMESMHANDPRMDEYIDKISALMARNREDSIALLRDCDDKHTIDWIYGSLDELAMKFPSDDLITVMQSLIHRFPEIEQISTNINAAINIVRINQISEADD